MHKGIVIIILVVVLTVVILVYLRYKCKRISEKRINTKNEIKSDSIDLKYSINISNEPGKNRWLYPTNEFGKMEEGKSDFEHIKHTVNIKNKKTDGNEQSTSTYK